MALLQVLLSGALGISKDRTHWKTFRVMTYINATKSSHHHRYRHHHQLIITSRCGHNTVKLVSENCYINFILF